MTAQAFLLTHNPAKSNPPEVGESNWSTGARHHGINPGDRIWLLRQGTGRHNGIIAKGRATSTIYDSRHWDDRMALKTAHYVDVQWTGVTHHDPIPIDVLRANMGHFNWAPQSGGILIPPHYAPIIETLWDQW